MFITLGEENDSFRMFFRKSLRKFLVFLVSDLIFYSTKYDILPFKAKVK